MKSLPAVVITAPMLVSSSVAEPDLSAAGPWWPTPGEVAWVTGTNYPVGSRVVRAAQHRVYRDTAGGVSSLEPEKDPVRWFNERPTNRYAWNDLRTSTPTLAASPYTLTVRPGAIADVALEGLGNVDSVRVQMWDAPGGELVYDHTASLLYWSGNPVISYYFDLPYKRRKVRLKGLPAHSGCEVTVTISSLNGEAVSVGAIAFGRFVELGCSEFEFEMKLRTYGSAESDKYGTTTLVDGPVARDLSGSDTVSAEDANRVADFLERYRNMACVWVTHDHPLYDYLSTVGVADVSLKPMNAREARLTMNIQGVVA